MADAQIEPSAGKLVQHAEFFDEPQGIVERQQVDERSEPDSLRALTSSGEEECRRWRHAKRCRVMLGQMIAEEPGCIRRLQELQPVLVELVQGRGATVDPIEQSKGNLCHATIRAFVVVLHVSRVNISPFARPPSTPSPVMRLLASRRIRQSSQPRSRIIGV